MEGIFEKAFAVSYHELDSLGNLRLLTILNYLQDCAGAHAARLGVSVADLRPRGVTWVLSRIHLLVERYPRAEETVVVRTWPATRRPVRLEEHLPPYPLVARRAVEDDFAGLPAFPDAATAEMVFRVLRGDLDINHHVNNTVFAGWAVEAVPDWIATGALAELEIAFRSEALYGEAIVSRCAVVEEGETPCCLHQIVNSRYNKELARLRTRWRR